MNKIILGKEEWVSLPQLGLPAIKARVDSGAQTSSLHALNVRPFEREGKSFVSFDIHPIQGDRNILLRAVAPLLGTRLVRPANGISERRYVILTRMRMDAQEWDIEITLSNRDEMGFRMLLGRQAMQGRVLVDPSRSYLLGSIPTKDAHELYEPMPEPPSGLRIAVLASNPDLYSNRRLMEAGEARGHTMRFINIAHCIMNINAADPVVLYRGGERLDQFDAVIPRIKPSMTFYGCAVMRQFEAQGVFCLNDAVSIARSRDKLRSLQMLAEKGVEMPTSSFAHSPLDTKSLIEMVGGAPLIIKLLEGTQGRGVVLAETNKAAESVINAFKTVNANILVQEFVKEADGKDIRCFVVAGKVVGSMQRVAAEGEFRANLHQGGRAEAVKITRLERQIALKSARCMGLHVAGVDIIRAKDGPKVLEINSSPGLEGIEAVTGSDMAGLMIHCIEHHVIARTKAIGVPITARPL